LLTTILSSMLVKDLMITDPPTIEANAYIYEALKKINERGIGRVLVLSDGKLTGIVSTRDVINLVDIRCRRACDKSDVYGMIYRTVEEIMSPQPQVAYEEMEPLDALTIMVARNFGALPVLNRVDKLVGIVTEREMLLLFQDMEELFPVRRFMSKKVKTAYKDATVMDAVSLMARGGFRRLPVTDEQGKVLGIVTASDVVKRLAKEVTKGNPEEFLKKPLSEVMNRQVLTINPEDSVNQAAGKMVVERVGSLLILDSEGKAAGIITERDLVIALYHQLHLTLK
jgi:CBS domain-containing protein